MIYTPDQNLLALSWKEPYGTLMLHGKIETRKWATKYRGFVLICASKKKYNYSSVLQISGEHQAMRIDEVMSKYPTNYSVDGKAIAIGRLVDCRSMTRYDADQCFVEYFSNLYCHVYEDVQKIKPFPWKGARRWRTVTDQEKQLISFDGVK